VPVLSFITAMSGAVIGNRVKIVNITWFGLIINKPLSVNGSTAGKITTVVH
jgi:hypothetical protein